MAILKHIASKNADYGEAQRNAKRKVTEKEYHAKRSGQKKLEERNQQMISEGITPRTTVFQTQKEYLRTSIEQAATSAHDLKKFEQILSEKFNIKFKISRGRFSYLHPDRDKPITGRNLGTHYEKDYLMEVIENNSHLENAGKDQTVQKEILSKENIHTPTAPFEKSGLRLVTDLQHCIKAQQSCRRYKIPSFVWCLSDFTFQMLINLPESSIPDNVP